MKKLIYISIILLASLTTLKAQPDWVVDIDGTNGMTLFFLDSSDITIKGDPLSERYVFGAFYQEPGQAEICVGISRWFQQEGAQLQISGFDDTARHPSIGDSIYLKVYDNVQQCEIKNIKPPIGNWTGVFEQQAFYTINSLRIEANQRITYTTTACKSDDIILPEVSNDIQEFSIGINSNFPTSVDSSGSIWIAQSDTGSLFISMRSDQCLVSNMATILIQDGPACNKPLEPGNESFIAPYDPDPNYHQVKLKFSGEIQIFDGNGVMVRKLQGPVNWDGTDGSGNLLPSDEYYIISGTRSRTVTILH